MTTAIDETALQTPAGKLVRKLGLGYALGLFTVGCLLLAGQVVVHKMLVAQERDAATINVAGRQRMLSQKIVKNILHLQIGQDAQTTQGIISTIANDLNTWRTVHRQLRSGFAGTGSVPTTRPAIQAHFDNLELHFQLMNNAVSDIVGLGHHARAAPLPISRQSAIVASHEGSYLEVMDGIVQEYESEARERVRQLRQTEIGLSVALGAVLLLQALLIFRPLTRQVRATILDLSRSRQAAENLSLQDELTGVANRRRFEHELGREWLRASRNRSSLSVIMIDLDNFKGLNDSSGHEVGDQCLARIGGTLNGELRRPTDLVSRYGGDEFVVLLPDTDQAGAESVASRLRERIVALEIRSGEGTMISISTGVAAGNPAHRDVDPHRLVAQADRHMLKSKTDRDGNLRVVPEMES